ncbi:hypothetical protein [Kamptonema formosum]|uniref:hypothetical protein n=1 Tax=Kamptonema formosum TaxID=331992 RepID=UPI0012DD3AE3|nr:hypothetical protein [Oscillatoria sp. PCC 10802]
MAGLIISNSQSIVQRIYKVTRLSQQLAFDDFGSNCQPEGTGGEYSRKAAIFQGEYRNANASGGSSWLPVMGLQPANTIASARSARAGALYMPVR